MGPVAAVAAVATTGIIVHNKSRRSHHEQVDVLRGTYNIGGTLTNIQTQSLVNQKGVIKNVSELDAYLRGLGVPQAQVQEAQKFKFCAVGKVQDIKFEVQNGTFASKVVVIKSRKTSATQVCLNVNIDVIKANYSPPQVQQIYSRSGARYTSRGLTAAENTALVNSVKVESEKVKANNLALTP